MASSAKAKKKTIMSNLTGKSPFRKSLTKGKRSLRMPIGQARERIGESLGVSAPEIQKFLKGFPNTKDPGKTEGPATRGVPVGEKQTPIKGPTPKIKPAKPRGKTKPATPKGRIRARRR